MLVGFTWLLALLVIWFDIRHPSVAGSSPPSRCRLGRGDAVAFLVILGAYLPLVPLLRIWARLPGFLPGDARTHALVAMHLFDGGMGTGWSDRYVGGFPLALHYPILGWLLVGLPMRLGLDPTRAVQGACTIALVSTSLVAYLLGRFNRAGIVPCLAAALTFAGISPLNPFVGGYESFFITGLVSQVLVLPLLLCWVGTTLGRGSSAGAAGFAGLCFLTHPQIAIAATVLLGVVVVVSARRDAIVRFSISIVMAGGVAVLVYGPGIAHFQLPFGWPPNPQWLQLGFGPDRLDDWFVDGDLLDRDRPPILTAIWLACASLAAARWRHAAARTVIAASVGAVMLSILGPGIAAAGKLGQVALTILQPLRAMALIPVAVAATILVGLDLHRDTLDRMIARLARRNRSLRKLCVVLILALPTVAVAFCSRSVTTKQWASSLDRFSTDFPCGARGPNRSDWHRLRETIGTLDAAGRLWFDEADEALPELCAVLTGFERQSPVPIANARGVGAHVGFLAAVNGRLAPELPGLAARAEALGIRYVMLGRPLGRTAEESFERLGAFGELYLYARVGGSNLFGAGCVRKQWSGKNTDLERALKSVLATDSALNSLMDPANFQELSIGDAPLQQASVTDVCRSEGVLLSNATHTVGEHRVTVETAAPTDIVLRVTAYPTWHWRVDGQRVSPKLIFPGYYAVRVGAGRHQLEVTHRFGVATLAGLLLVILGPLMTWLVTRKRRF